MCPRSHFLLNRGTARRHVAPSPADDLRKKLGATIRDKRKTDQSESLRAYRSNQLWWAVVILIPTLVLAPLLLFVVLRQEFVWVNTEGTVVDRVKDGRHWYYVVDFTHRGGYPATAKAIDNPSDDYRVNDRIEIRYDPYTADDTYDAHVGHGRPWTRVVAFAIPVCAIVYGFYRLITALRLPRGDSAATDPPATRRRRGR